MIYGEMDNLMIRLFLSYVGGGGGKDTDPECH